MSKPLQTIHQEIEQDLEPDTPDLQKREFKTLPKHSSRTSTRTSGTRPSQTYKCIFSWSNGKNIINEQDSAFGRTKLCQKTFELSCKGLLPVVTGPDMGHPTNSGVYTNKPFKSVFRKYGKMHGVYVSPDDSQYTLNALFYHADPAEEYADMLHNDQDGEFVIVSSIERTKDVHEAMTRGDLELQGHHYMVS